MRKSIRPLAAAVAGGMQTLALAPFNQWWCGILSLALFAGLLRGLNGRRRPVAGGLWLGFCYGLGLFVSGSSWVYVSITDFGGAPAPLGAFLTGLFAIFMALQFMLPFAVIGRFRAPPWSFALAFAALWLLGELLRTWLFSGFPWLFAGYAHTRTWLAGWAPLLGVYGIGAILAFTAAVIALLARGEIALRWRAGAAPRQRFANLALIVVAVIFWPAGALLAKVAWTWPSPDSKPLVVGMVQANIPQEKKWLPSFRGETIRRFQRGTAALRRQGVDVVIWPEAALPLRYNRVPDFMQSLQREAERSKIDLISGVLVDEPGQRGGAYNAAAVFGRHPQLYYKRQLVPFGEYVPLEDWIRGTIEFFDLPTAVIRPGPAAQPPLRAGGASWAPLICYEIVYPSLVAASAADAQLLLTISNDAWFGKSIGPLQHMQMAQMRALETRRYLVRATNTGVTAIVDPNGAITAQLPQFELAELRGSVQPRTGATPFMRFGAWGPLALALAMLLAAGLLQRQSATLGTAAIAR